ncbi:muconolactone Delta-isomerase family protein [Streptomyces sp. NPDC097727]|uniref:muconolactone Delta-isomerase family protein n=1 Tax=Streptomyces sp. NPDC097727 TaxID=3366092 RepID=UPI003829D151
MGEFLVELATTVFEGSGPAEVDRRRAEESVGAGGLAAAGHLVRLWCPVGELRGIGLWGAADEGELYEKVLGTLPLWRARRTAPPRMQGQPLRRPTDAACCRSRPRSTSPARVR